MGNRNRPTPEFRREAAVRLAQTSGRTRREISNAEREGSDHMVDEVDGICRFRRKYLALLRRAVGRT